MGGSIVLRNKGVRVVSGLGTVVCEGKLLTVLWLGFCLDRKVMIFRIDMIFGLG